MSIVLYLTKSKEKKVYFYMKNIYGECNTYRKVERGFKRIGVWLSVGESEAYIHGKGIDEIVSQLIINSIDYLIEKEIREDHVIDYLELYSNFRDHLELLSSFKDSLSTFEIKFPLSPLYWKGIEPAFLEKLQKDLSHLSKNVRYLERILKTRVYEENKTVFGNLKEIMKDVLKRKKKGNIQKNNKTNKCNCPLIRTH